MQVFDDKQWKLVKPAEPGSPRVNQSMSISKCPTASTPSSLCRPCPPSHSWPQSVPNPSPFFSQLLLVEFFPQDHVLLEVPLPHTENVFIKLPQGRRKCAFTTSASLVLGIEKLTEWSRQSASRFACGAKEMRGWCGIFTSNWAQDVKGGNSTLALQSSLPFYTSEYENTLGKHLNENKQAFCSESGTTQMLSYL